MLSIIANITLEGLPIWGILRAVVGDLRTRLGVPSAPLSKQARRFNQAPLHGLSCVEDAGRVGLPSGLRSVFWIAAAAGAL